MQLSIQKMQLFLQKLFQLFIKLLLKCILLLVGCLSIRKLFLVGYCLIQTVRVPIYCEEKILNMNPDIGSALEDVVFLSDKKRADKLIDQFHFCATGITYGDADERLNLGSLINTVDEDIINRDLFERYIEVGIPGLSLDINNIWAMSEKAAKECKEYVPFFTEATEHCTSIMEILDKTTKKTLPDLARVEATEELCKSIIAMTKNLKDVCFRSACAEVIFLNNTEEKDYDADECLILAISVDILYTEIKRRGTRGMNRYVQFLHWVENDAVYDIIAGVRLDTAWETVEELAKECKEHLPFIKEINAHCRSILTILDKPEYRKQALPKLEQVELMEKVCEEQLPKTTNLNLICSKVMGV